MGRKAGFSPKAMQKAIEQYSNRADNKNAGVFLKHHMEKYKENMEKIPEEEIAIVPPTLGLKIIDELLTVTNEDIAELFINLLTNASTLSGVRYAHPSFIEVIKNISEDEAKIINEVYHRQQNNVQYTYLAKLDGGVIPLTDKVNNVATLLSLNFEENSTVYMENFIKLGILEDTSVYYDFQIDEFEKLEHILLEKKKLFEERVFEQQKNGKWLNASIILNKGNYILSSYGKSFVDSVTSNKASTD
ncbi:DUF4393 domain-containing protein [Psychrobacillus sp. FSL H8-0487]|uniref:DUF4393 domain-containing protein n=1 Tax=Psychrobacillus sp. FSL H8-0487 TaxID=2921391 RepID=UPI0030FB6D41